MTGVKDLLVLVGGFAATVLLGRPRVQTDRELGQGTIDGRGRGRPVGPPQTKGDPMIYFGLSNYGGNTQTLAASLERLRVEPLGLGAVLLRIDAADNLKVETDWAQIGQAGMGGHLRGPAGEIGGRQGAFQDGGEEGTVDPEQVNAFLGLILTVLSWFSHAGRQGNEGPAPTPPQLRSVNFGPVSALPMFPQWRRAELAETAGVLTAFAARD